MATRQPLGRYLLETGYIDAAQLQNALSYQRQWGGRLGEALVALHILSESAMLDGLARKHGVPFIEIGDQDVPREVLRLVPERIIRERKVLPLALVGGPGRVSLVVATGEPHDLAALTEVEFASGRTVRPVLASDGDIAQAIDRHLGARRSVC